MLELLLSKVSVFGLLFHSIPDLCRKIFLPVYTYHSYGITVVYIELVYKNIWCICLYLPVMCNTSIKSFREEWILMIT